MGEAQPSCGLPCFWGEMTPWALPGSQGFSSASSPVPHAPCNGQALREGTLIQGVRFLESAVSSLSVWIRRRRCVPATEMRWPWGGSQPGFTEHRTSLCGCWHPLARLGNWSQSHCQAWLRERSWGSEALEGPKCQRGPRQKQLLGIPSDTCSLSFILLLFLSL